MISLSAFEFFFAKNPLAGGRFFAWLAAKTNDLLFFNVYVMFFLIFIKI